jgi:hypothetical protein
MRVQNYLIIILGILLSSMAYASCMDSGFYDNFDYGTPFTANGWLYSSSCGLSCDKNYPIPSPFGTNAFAYDSTGNCTRCGGNTRTIYRNLLVNYTNEILEVSFMFGFYNDSTKINSPFILQLGETVSRLRMSIYSSYLIGNEYYIAVYNGTGSGGFLGGTVLECNTSYNSFVAPTELRIYLVLDMASNRFNLYINETLVCDNSIAYGNEKINYIRISNVLDNLETASFYLDNFLICSSSGIILGELGSPCENNEDCLTGKCEYKQCVKKQGSEECTDNSQCVSNQCIGGLCKKPSLSENMEESKTELFGSDQASSNWVSIILMVGSAIAVVSGTGGTSIGILIALGVIYLEGFFFAYIGWLSVFILLALVVVALIIVVFAFLIKGRSD